MVDLLKLCSCCRVAVCALCRLLLRGAMGGMRSVIMTFPCPCFDVYLILLLGKREGCFA